MYILCGSEGCHSGAVEWSPGVQFTHHFSSTTEIQNSFLLLHAGNTPCRHVVLLNKVYYNDIKQCTGKNISNLTFQKILSLKLRLKGLLPPKIIILPI